MKMRLQPWPRVNIYPTLRCNLNCPHCYFRGRDRNTEELSTAQWISVIKQLKKWLGPFFLTITGGEPLLRQDVFDLIACAHAERIFVCLNTNGTLLTPDLVARIPSSGLGRLLISLDGMQQTHDVHRGGGVFRRVTAALQALAGTAVNRCLATTIMTSNIGELSEMVHFAQSAHAQIMFQGLFVTDTNRHLWPSDRGESGRAFAALMREKRRTPAIYNSLHSLQKLARYYDGSFSHTAGLCVAHNRSLKIKADGSMNSCEHFFYQGNAGREDVRRLWRSRENAAVRRRMKGCRRDCSYLQCHYYDTFGELIGKGISLLKG